MTVFGLCVVLLTGECAMHPHPRWQFPTLDECERTRAAMVAEVPEHLKQRVGELRCVQLATSTGTTGT